MTDLTKDERLKAQYAILMHIAKICREREITCTDDVVDLLCEISDRLPDDEALRAMLNEAPKIVSGAA